MPKMRIRLAERIRARFNLDAQVLAGQVRLEQENGHRFITDVVEAFPGEIEVDLGQQAVAGRCFHSPHRPSILDGKMKNELVAPASAA